MKFFLYCLLIITLLASCGTSSSGIYPLQLYPQDSLFANADKLKILSSVGLRLRDKNGWAVSGISAIAWDKDEQILYALSDNGSIYHLQLIIEKNTIANVVLLEKYPLLDAAGKRLKPRWRDSEGLSLTGHKNGKKGDTRLLIAFENLPRIVLYSADGQYQEQIPISKQLERRNAYRHRNKSLESVIVHPQLGVLTAAEYPLRQDPMSLQRIYATNGKSWPFKAAEAKNAAVTGLEALDDGGLLVLERAWAGIEHPIVVTLSELSLEDCGGEKLCRSKELLRMTTAEGWLLDNFEGLSHYQGKQYLMISDDNNRFYQTTILVLFEINQPPAE